MIVTPTVFLEKRLTPISQEIDGFGGFNVLVGLIAAGGEPHVTIVGNVSQQPTLAKEIYEALSVKFKELANQGSAPSNIITMPGSA